MFTMLSIIVLSRTYDFFNDNHFIRFIFFLYGITAHSAACTASEAYRLYVIVWLIGGIVTHNLARWLGPTSSLK